MDSKVHDPYSPQTVSDIVGNTDLWTSISTKIENKNCPHLIICGPAGIGKSTFVRNCLYKRGYTYLVHNCIADSGLRDVRDAIRSFARGGIDSNKNHRWIILEHADSLTADTQAFLRRLLETASGSTRFVFEVRESGAISEPILSRSWLCTVDTPSQPEIRYEILRRTNHEMSFEEADRIAYECCGNVRSAIHQALAIWRNKMPSDNIGSGAAIINERWACKPEGDDEMYSRWLCETIQLLRKQGADPRTFLRLKMNGDSHALRVLSQWNRPGGASSRALWLHAMSQGLDQRS
jgi:DNA polymerase III delta prime subunit